MTDNTSKKSESDIHIHSANTVMSENTTNAKRARANTDAETITDEKTKKELITEIRELRKVVALLAQTQTTYIDHFNSMNDKLNELHMKNIEMKATMHIILHNTTKNENTTKIVQSQTAKTAEMLKNVTLQNTQQQQLHQQQQQQQQSQQENTQS